MQQLFVPPSPRRGRLISRLCFQGSCHFRARHGTNFAPSGQASVYWKLWFQSDLLEGLAYFLKIRFTPRISTTKLGTKDSRINNVKLGDSDLKILDLNSCTKVPSNLFYIFTLAISKCYGKVRVLFFGATTFVSARKSHSSGVRSLVVRCLLFNPEVTRSNPCVCPNF